MHTHRLLQISSNLTVTEQLAMASLIDVCSGLPSAELHAFDQNADMDHAFRPLVLSFGDLDTFQHLGDAAFESLRPLRNAKAAKWIVCRKSPGLLGATTQQCGR